jgi:hypothetical protein
MTGRHARFCAQPPTMGAFSGGSPRVTVTAVTLCHVEARTWARLSQAHCCKEPAADAAGPGIHSWLTQ